MCILGVFGIDVESVSKNLRMFFPEEFSTPSFKNPRGANALDCPPIWAPMLCVPTSLPKEIAFWKQVDKSFHKKKSVVSATEVRGRRRVRQHFVWLAGTRTWCGYNQTRLSSLISDSASVHKSLNGWPSKLLRSAASVASDERVWKQMSNVTQRCTILESGHRMTPCIYDWMHFQISRLCAKMPSNDRTSQQAFGLVFFWFRYKYSCGLLVWCRLNDVAS